MTQYIELDPLVWELKSIRTTARIKAEIASANSNVTVAALWSGKENVCNELLSLLDTFEMKDVDLDEEIEKCLKRHNMLAVGKKEFSNIAKHFFKLGMQVNNPITAADKGTAEEIIINLTQVEEEYQIDLTKEKNWVLNKVQKGE